MIQKQSIILLKKIIKSLKTIQEKRQLIITITTTELIFRQIPEDQMSPKKSKAIFINYKRLKF